MRCERLSRDLERSLVGVVVLMWVAGVACGGGPVQYECRCSASCGGYVVKGRVNGWKVRVVVENLAVCCG